MDTDGLFRVSAAQNDVSDIIQKFNRGKGIILIILDLTFISGNDIDFQNLNPHVLGSLLKSYFRTLPEPLFTFPLYDKFIALTGNSFKRLLLTSKM